MEKLKVICLMPVKNEADLLPLTLPILTQYCDVVIVADQMSTDGSREIYKQFPKVQVIDNLRERHTNQTRWDLLRAAREYDGNNFLLALDADEYIPPTIFKEFFDSREFMSGESFRFPWIQLWKSVDYYNNSGIWYRNYQRCAWVDDRKTNYEEKIDVIDDLPRMPGALVKNCLRIDDVPVIHLQWVSWRKTQIKQAWYRCLQLIHGSRSGRDINYAYSFTLDENGSKLQPIDPQWFAGAGGLKSVESLPPVWHLQAIFEFFEKYGIEFFEPLQIWHIAELEQEFIKRTGRKPVSQTESAIVQGLKNFKRFAKKIIRY